VAARKVAALLEAQARVTVVAPEFDVAFEKMAGHPSCGHLKLVRRPFGAADLKGQSLAFAATNDLALNARIAQQAGQRGIWVNVAAPGDAGNFQVPAALWRGPLCVAVSTGGASAGLARTLRDYLDGVLGPEWGQLAALLESRRARILKRLPEPASRRALLQRLSAPDWARKIKQYGIKRVAREIDALIAECGLRTADWAAHIKGGDRNPIQNPKSKIQNPKGGCGNDI
jgi:precorrin-2 dehydrogenase/sirohydrochlorin ferrochelatase